jgi:phosphotriesterase-related protein
MTLMTVAGPVGADGLGRVLVHEHVQISYAGEALDPKPALPRHERVGRAVERMRELAASGVRTFVDPAPIELGRDPELLAEISERSGMQIVCATGFYHEHDGAGIPYYWRQRWPEEIAELFLHEIDEGIGATGVRPGVVKIATGDPISRHERKAVRGAGLAAAESGLAVISHTERSSWGAEQQDILEEAGVDLGRCLIGHQDEQTDLAVLVAIAKRGSYVGIDRIGMTNRASDDARADMVAALVESGFGSRICLSQDHLCCLPAPRDPYWVPPGRTEWFDREVRPALEEQMFARPHTFIFTDFLPRLTARGVDPSVVESILTDNPRRLLIGE